MSVIRMMSLFSYVVAGITVCWIRDSRGVKASVMAIIPESNHRASDALYSKKMVAKARMTVEREAKRIGTILSVGVFMGGEGKGSVSAYGIADVKLTPETERRLNESGITKVQ